MSGDQGMNSLYLALCLILVGSSLIGMRMPLGKAVKMALAWVAIFGVGFILFAFRGEFSALGAKLQAELTGTSIQSGEELRVAMRDDGHFWVEASVNGQSARFLVDSGASITTVSPAVAAAAKVQTGIRVAQVNTANGAVQMPVAKVETFEVGPIVRQDFTIHVNAADDTNVLGMNFLSSLESWRVEGNTLVLEP
jgi:aspartyl protease family protein